MSDKKKINTAVLSYGMSGEVFHVPLLAAHKGFEISHIWQRSPDKPVKHSYPVATSYDEILRDESIDLIVVNTPNDTHFPFAMKALKAGKHVIVEKPFTVTVTEADELIALAVRQKKILTVFQNRRWDSDFATVKKIVNSQLLGQLVECEIHYDRFRNYIEQGTWKEERGQGTGILYNLGSHLLDQVFVLFGMPQYIDARIGIQRPGGKVDDFFDIRMEYDRLLVILKSSYLVREPGPRFVLHGTQGSFVKHGIDPQEQALKDKKIPGSAGWGMEPKESWGKLNTTTEGKHIEGPFENLAGNYLGFYDNVYDAVSANAPLAVKPEESRKVIELIEACYESSGAKKAVKIQR
jgi:scyllo-inositol 2-dehydrogenase (NADP+)